MVWVGTLCHQRRELAGCGYSRTTLPKSERGSELSFAAPSCILAGYFAELLVERQKSLASRVNSHLPANQAVRRTWDDLNKLRSGLAADPVRDESGNLVIPEETPQACDLP